MPMASFADEQTDYMQGLLEDVWDKVMNNVQNGMEAQGNKLDETNRKMDELNTKVDNIDNQKEVTDYLDSVKDDEEKDDDADKIEDDVKIDTSGSINKGLAVPRAMAKLANYLFDCFKWMIYTTDPAAQEYLDSETKGLYKGFFGNSGINLAEITDSTSPLSKAADVMRIFAYSLVLLFFAVTIVEQSIKYEIFTLKGIARIFGRLLLAKIIIDLSTTVCLIIIKIVGYLTFKILDSAQITVNIFPDIYLKASKTKIIGPIIDLLVGIIVGFIFLLIILLVLIPICIVLMKLVMRSIELAVLMTVAPAFFACLSTDVTKEYFKKFMSIFLQVACQTLFMVIPIVVCANHFTSEPVQMNGLSALVATLRDIMPNILIFTAMLIMMIKPPKVLTNLIK
jgi:hypothetical protein